MIISVLQQLSLAKSLRRTPPGQLSCSTFLWQNGRAGQLTPFGLYNNTEKWGGVGWGVGDGLLGLALYDMSCPKRGGPGHFEV